MKLLILTPRFIKSNMRGGEEVARYIYQESKNMMDTYVITSDGLDIRYQHSIFSRSLRKNRDEMIVDSHIYYLRSFPLINMVARTLLKFLQEISPKRKGAIYRYILGHLKVIAHGPYIPSLKRVIKHINPDLIWGSIYPNELSVAAFYISKKLRIPFIYTPYYHYRVEEFNEPYILKKIAKEATFLVASTKNEEYELINLGSNKEAIKTINLGISPRTIPNDYDILNYKKKLNIDSHFIVLTQAWADKGIIQVLNAMADYSKIHNDLTLLTIGDPDEKYLNLKKTILDPHKKLNIIDLGWVNDKELPFASADVFVMLSKNDAFGLSYLDALSMKVPVIAMKDTSGDDIISDKIDGFLVKGGSTDELIVIFDLLRNNKALKSELGENGVKKVKEKFNSTKMTDEYIITFHEVVRKYRHE